MPASCDALVVLASVWLAVLAPLCCILLTGHVVFAMAFLPSELEAALEKVPSSEFLKLGGAARVHWLEFVASVDEKPKDSHEVGFYAIVARALAEAMGTTQPADYAESHMRDMIVSTLKVGATPFQNEGEHEFWSAARILPAHVSLALRVQKRAAGVSLKVTDADSRAALPGSDALAHVMQQYVASQQAVLDKERKRGTLTYDLKARVSELGLEKLPDIPSEEAMLRLEASSKAAHAQGRHYIGSAEGEDLHAHFRPAWSRTPKLDVIVGEGSLEEKIRSAIDARKSRTMQEKVDFVGYANFQGHVLDWGLKMILTKVFTPVDLLGYQCVLARVAEEHGGVRTAYYYDLLLRLAVAKALEKDNADVQEMLCKLDRDVLTDAKSKVDKQVKSAGNPSGVKAGNPKGGKAASGHAHDGGGKSSGGYWPAPQPPRSRSPHSSGKGDKGDKGDRKQRGQKYNNKDGKGGADNSWGRGSGDKNWGRGTW